MELKFRVPGSSEPGYLKRERKRLRYVNLLRQNYTNPDIVNEMMEWLCEFVDEPVEKEDKLAALEMASKDQIHGLLESIKRAGDVNPTSDEPSEST